MKKYLPSIIVVFYSILLFSCQQEKKDTETQNSTDKENVSSESNSDIVVIEHHWNNCDNRPKAGCIDVRIQYPSLVQYNSEAIGESLNEHIRGFLADFLSTEEPIEEPDLKKYIEKSIMAKQEKFQSGMLNYSPILRLNLIFETIFQNENITSVYTKYTSYRGGAHPNSGAGYYIFKNNSGEQLDNNIIAKDMDLKRNMLAILKQRAGQPNTDISEIGYLVTDLEFAVSNNIGVTKDSLFITYSPYEIAPYAMGFQNFAFSKQEVEDYLSKQFLNLWNTPQ